MRASGIGRVLVASLHQGIADVLPARLAFYEGWLNAEQLRGGTIGLAPLLAVLSFLRAEGHAYDEVVARAGCYAAEWTVESMPRFERQSVAALPIWLRRRLALRLGQRLVRECCRTSRAVGRLRRGAGSVELCGSIFCTVREPVPRPLCGFYAAAIGRLMELFAVDVSVVVASCGGTGASACILAVSPAVGEAHLTPEVPAA